MKSKCDYRVLEEQYEDENGLIDGNDDSQIVPVHRTHQENLRGDKTGEVGNREVKNFRDDISLLRAFAILSVLGYHHWPSIFPLGFIGVDIFFVISGFLMMQILERTKNERFWRIFLTFYWRRVKRIVPLYYLILFLIGFLMMFIYTSIWVKQYFNFYFGAIFFYPNLMLIQADGDYFAENTEKLPFLHSWSLGVEMQYYLIAPILFYISKIQIFNLKVGVLLVISTLISSLFFQFNSLPIISFYHPFSRVWQFLCGGLASIYGEKMKTTFPSSISIIFSPLFLLITSFIFFPLSPKITPPSILQVIITLSSSAFIFFSSNCTIQWSSFRLNYISTISYSLYLVHFPVLRFTEYLQGYWNINIYVPLISLLITFPISSFLHHFYEKPLLKADKWKISLVTLRYFCFCLLIGWKWELVVHPNCAQKAAISENSKFLSSTYPIKGGHYIKDGFGNPSPPWGHYIYEGDKGKLKIVIMGNSWAAQEAHLVREYFPQKNVSEMHLFSQSGFTFGLHGDSKVVQKEIPFFMEFLKKLQPDYVFILARFHAKHSRDLSPFQGLNDTVADEYLRGVRNISLFTKKIFIQTHQPFECQGKEKNLMNHFLDSLQKGEDLSKYNRPFNVTAFYNGPVYKRLQIVFKNCPKCYPIEIAGSFIDRKRQILNSYDVDSQLLYFDNGCHLTDSGFKMIKESFQKSIENGINDTNKENNGTIEKWKSEIE